MRTLLIAIVTVLAAAPAAGQDADAYRGGWRTDGGEAHTYQFSIRGTTVRGIYCTYCADATTLAFVDGTFGPDGIRFQVTHVNGDGSTAFTDTAVARFSDGRLVVSGTRRAPRGGAFEHVLIKDPRGPDPLPVALSVLPKGMAAPPVRPERRNPDGADGLPYIQPGPWKPVLTENDVVGVWLGFGVGAPKQYFIIRKVGDRPIPTFEKHVTARIGWNEMRCTTAADHMPVPPARPGTVPGFSLQGPIAIEATAGNRWSEWPPAGTSSPR